MFRLMMVAMTIALVFQPNFFGEEKLVIGIGADGETMESAVAEVAGRAAYFLIVDAEGTLLEALENPYKDNRGSAGVSAVDFFAERNVTLVIAGRFGNKMKAALEAKEIAFMEFAGVVAAAVAQVIKEYEKP